MADSALLIADWPAPENIHACTTLRSGPGVSSAPFDRFNLGMNSGDVFSAVAENRRRLVEIARLPNEPRWLQQVHGTAVADMDFLVHDREERGSEANEGSHGDVMIADASRTSRSDVVLAILTADCLPVLFCDNRGTEVAAAHAGWRGLAAGVLEATVAAMRTTPANILVWIGPAAGSDAYEVGEEVRNAFVAENPATTAMFQPTRPGHWLANLYGLAKLRLMNAGIPAMSVHGGDLCTISDLQRFYSHRRDGRTGRMASLIWIKG